MLQIGPSKEMNKQNRKTDKKHKSFCCFGECSLCYREKHAGLIVSEEVDSRLPACTAAWQAAVAADEEEGKGRLAGLSARWLRPCRLPSRGNPALGRCFDLSSGGIVHDLGESHCSVACWLWAMIVAVRTTGRMFTVASLEAHPFKSRLRCFFLLLKNQQ